MSFKVPSQTLLPTTAALHPTTTNFKRLSTVKSNSSSPGKKPQSLASNLASKSVVSPAELCGFVDTLLGSLETRFEDMSEQVLARMDEMSFRIDNLETAIHDLIHEDIDQSPLKPTPTGTRTS